MKTDFSEFAENWEPETKEADTNNHISGSTEKFKTIYDDIKQVADNKVRLHYNKIDPNIDIITDNFNHHMHKMIQKNIYSNKLEEEK